MRFVTERQESIAGRFPDVNTMSAAGASLASFAQCVLTGEGRIASLLSESG